MTSKCLKCGAVLSLGVVLSVQLCKNCLVIQPPDLLSELKTPPISKNIEIIRVAGAISSVQSSATAGAYLEEK